MRRQALPPMPIVSTDASETDCDETFEHSIFGVVGAWAQPEQAKVALPQEALLSVPCLTSYSVWIDREARRFSDDGRRTGNRTFRRA